MKTIVTLLAVCFAFLASAQEPKIYRIREGKLMAVVYSDSGSINFGSNEIRFVIDNETSRLIMRLEPAKISCDSDSLDSELKMSLLPDVLFDGTISGSVANTKGHPEQEFEIDGKLTIGEIGQQVSMAAVLRNYPSGPEISSMLYIHFELDLVKYGLTGFLPAGATVGCVEILLPILEPSFSVK
jgi:hypothetical protein